MLFLLREEGQGLLEYGLVIILLAIAVVAVLILLGPIISDLFQEVIDAFET
jgi:pilus assembly protein Flp/PilA